MEDIIYLDSHAHLMSDDYSEDLEDVMHRCKQKHIDYIMIITLTKQEAIRAIEFRKRDPEHITIATGIFPEDAEKVTEEDWNDFVKIASREEISVIGEIGLEYHWVKDEEARKNCLFARLNLRKLCINQLRCILEMRFRIHLIS